MQSLDNVSTFENEKLSTLKLLQEKNWLRPQNASTTVSFHLNFLSTLYVMKDTGERTQEGGFRLKGCETSRGCQDILRNSRMYGTECATAIVIVFYLALVEVMPVELFDRLFSDIYLMDWKYLDSDLGVRTYRGVKNALPGDCLYFKNPDVNPDTPEWQGENVIVLLNNYYWSWNWD